MTPKARCTPGLTMSGADRRPPSGFSKRVLEGYPAFAVLYHLDQLKVAQAMRANPEARLLVLQKGTAVVLEEG